MNLLSALKDQSRVSWRLLASALLVAVFATGCGGGGDDSSVLDAGSAAANSVTSAADTSSASGRAKASAASWVYCSYEGGTCSFSGTRQVRYAAANGAAVVKTFTSRVTCSNAVFGDPASGQRKTCYYDASTTTSGSTAVTTPVTTTPTSTSGSFSKSQIFAMRNQYVSGQQGQYTNLDLRFYGVPLYTNAKVLVHLYDGNGALRAQTGHHLRYIATNSWRGYVQYQHPTYIPAGLAVGTYRAVVGLYTYTSPWTVLLSQIAGNGVSQMGQGHVVGYVTVNRATTAAVADQTVGPFLAITPSSWY